MGFLDEMADDVVEGLGVGVAGGFAQGLEGGLDGTRGSRSGAVEAEFVAIARSEGCEIVIGDTEDFAEDTDDFEAVLGMSGNPNESGQPSGGGAVALLLVGRVELDGEVEGEEFALEVEEPVFAGTEDGDLGPGVGTETGRAEGADFLREEAGLVTRAHFGGDFFSGRRSEVVRTGPTHNLA